MVECPGCRIDGLLGDVLLDDACLHHWHDCLCHNAKGKGIGIVHCSIGANGSIDPSILTPLESWCPWQGLGQ